MVKEKQKRRGQTLSGPQKTNVAENSDDDMSDFEFVGQRVEQAARSLGRGQRGLGRVADDVPAPPQPPQQDDGRHVTGRVLPQQQATRSRLDRDDEEDELVERFETLGLRRMNNIR